MRASTSEDGDLITHFDKFDESGIEVGKTSLKHLCIDNPDLPANKGKNKGHQPLEHIFGICRTL